MVGEDVDPRDADEVRLLDWESTHGTGRARRIGNKLPVPRFQAGDASDSHALRTKLRSFRRGPADGATDQSLGDLGFGDGNRWLVFHLDALLSRFSNEKNYLLYFFFFLR